MAFAKHRKAFREVVCEGLLKACLVSVSIPSFVKMGSALVGSRPKTFTDSRCASRWCGRRLICWRSAFKAFISRVTSSSFAEPVSSVEDEDVLVLAIDMIDAFLSEKLEDVDLGNV